MAVFLNSRLEEQQNPSVFDITAYQGFQQITKPALDKLLDVLSSYSTSHLHPLHYYRDEIYLILNSILQYHYLNKSSASFAQQFYSLERRPISPGKERISLTRNFTIQIILPYLHNKINQQFHKSREDEMDGVAAGSSLAGSIRNWFVKIYPYSHASWGIVNLVILILFTLNKTKYHSVEAILAKYHLQYRDEENRAAVTRPDSKVSRVVSKIAKFLATGLEIGCFFLQVLEHYQSSNSDTKLGNKMVAAPPNMNSHGLSQNICPLCNKIRRDPTVVPASGIIYCYSCIAAYVRKKKKCAVTKIACASSQLVRLFP